MGDSLDATSDELYQHSPIALSLALPYIAHYDLTVLSGVLKRRWPPACRPVLST
jgi:hypothetical protein